MGLQYIRALCCCLFLQMLTSASSHIIKTRSCVGFEIDNFKNAHKVFDSVKGMSRRRCMIRCAGHSLCTGFSYHSHERACALSSGKMTCTSITRGLVGWLYAAMSPCQGQRPWRARRPSDEGLYWRVPDQTEDRVRSISRTLFTGMYIPGYWDGEIHYIVKPRTKTRTSCKARCGEILDLERTAGYSWTPLIPGDAVPANATVGGYGLMVHGLMTSFQCFCTIPCGDKTTQAMVTCFSLVMDLEYKTSQGMWSCSKIATKYRHIFSRRNH